MPNLQKLIDDSKSSWTDEYEKYVIILLDNVEGGKKRNRQEYHIRSKYLISELAGVTKVKIKSDDNILYMATKEKCSCNY